MGVTTGLAWTEVGGELLSIEAVMVPGKGKMTITGKLGDVMQESIQAARSYVQSRADRLRYSNRRFSPSKDIHVHVPEGATPKDGPSAGVTMVTSIVSVLTGIAVRKDVAMTGEVTLRGRVLVIGGLKEKLLAAHARWPEDGSHSARTTLAGHLSEIPENVKKGLTIIPVATVDEVLENALASKSSTPIDWDEDNIDGAIAKGDDKVGDYRHASQRRR